jgi:MSHA biogenesis protein MshM
MYLDYYSLDRPPFRITPDPSLFFTGGARGRGVVLEAMLYAINSGEGILKVVGEVGSGKTMLCRMLEERLPESVEIVYLANPNLTPHDILYAIAFELKLDVEHDTERLEILHSLQNYLLEQHANNRTVLVIVEEAQSMPIETLEEIRLFSNLETHTHKLMQVLLFGQPELDKNLENKNIRQLRERITHSFNLRPLDRGETVAYIRHRLHAAGCPCPQVFTDDAEKLIAKASQGLTRRINILADKAMLAAYAESATATRQRSLDTLLKPTVTARHVKAAIKDSGYNMSIFAWFRAFGTAAAILLFYNNILPESIFVSPAQYQVQEDRSKMFSQHTINSPHHGQHVAQ